MSGKLLQTNKLSIGFSAGKQSRHKLISGIDLTGMDGEIIAVIGRNGIGKSTLLKTLAGLLKPLSGEIRIDDQDIKKIRRTDMARLISFVSTEPVHVANLTVTDLVGYGRFPYTGFLGKLNNEDSRIVNEAIEQTGISHIASRYVDEISDGEKQHAMIARAFAQDTRLIILDEPTAFLDLPNRYGILRLLNELAHRKGKTVIFSTHDLGIALQEVDKIWLINENELLSGAPEDLIINKGFHKLFENSGFSFDSNDGQFKLIRKADKFVNLEGEGRIRYWTAKALERLGFEVTEAGTELKVIIADTKNRPMWKIIFKNEKMDFDSIYDLAAFLKSNTN